MLPPPIHSYTVPSVHVRRPYSSFAHGGGGGERRMGRITHIAIPLPSPPFPWLSYLSHRSDRALLLSVGGGGSGDRITSSSFPSSFGGVCTCAPLSFLGGRGREAGKKRIPPSPFPPLRPKIHQGIVLFFSSDVPFGNCGECVFPYIAKSE